MDIKNIKIKLDKKTVMEFVDRAKHILVTKNRLFLAVIGVVVLSYCGFLWYKFIANPEWNEEKKQEYIKSKEEKNSFKQNKFDGVIVEIERRKSEYNKKLENIPDIFRLK